MDSFSPRIWKSIQHMSESLFRGMCLLVGTSDQVAIRRDVEDIVDIVLKRLNKIDDFIFMLSGSRREGFRLEGSDMDIMCWKNDHRVILDMSQSEFYYTTNKTLILSDSSESPPGFALLQLLTPSTNREVSLACVRMKDIIYISSSIFVQLTWSAILPNSTVHGPCATGFFGPERGRMEYDAVECFVCDFWPPSASSWIDRCHSWPNPDVANDIIRNGCHFVAIGHPLRPHENKEWRISFSRAEQKCVYAMNQCQFLTYGLLKLFLKEVINQQVEETNKIMCSYHIKTAVFWVIQQNTLSHWCPQNLLTCFWACFKLLIKWVYEGVCPNFFIPQNNLFLTKIYGSAQNCLFLQLQELYTRGLACLLQSSSINSYIINVLCNPRLYICSDESLIRYEIDHDKELFDEIGAGEIGTLDLHRCIKSLHIIEQLLVSPLSRYQNITLQKLTVNTLQRTAFLLNTMSTDINKKVYIADKIIRYMLKLVAKFGNVSDMLYIAMYYYKTFRYKEALSIVEITKFKLAQPYIIYGGHVDRERYAEVMGGKTLSTKMNQALAKDIILMNTIWYINELIPEQQSSFQNRWLYIDIPVRVMLHFLEVLCYKHINTGLAQASLDELQFLIQNNREGPCLHMYGPLKDISWEILGICHQNTGNLRAALYSYQQSLEQVPWHRIQSATQWRIQDIAGLNPTDFV